MLESQVGTVTPQAFGMVLNTSTEKKVEHHGGDKSCDISK
jgi:hypothetical protein